MTTKMTYARARAEFAKLCRQVAENREIVVIARPSGEDVALISADELSSLLETAHLLRSPKNAERLLAALEQARSGAGEPQTLRELRQEAGVD